MENEVNQPPRKVRVVGERVKYKTGAGFFVTYQNTQADSNLILGLFKNPTTPGYFTYEIKQEDLNEN